MLKNNLLQQVFIEKNPRISRPTQFKPMLFKGLLNILRLHFSSFIFCWLVDHFFSLCPLKSVSEDLRNASLLSLCFCAVSNTSLLCWCPPCHFPSPHFSAGFQTCTSICLQDNSGLFKVQSELISFPPQLLFHFTFQIILIAFHLDINLSLPSSQIDSGAKSCELYSYNSSILIQVL